MKPSSGSLPLAAAAVRLRSKPGRPPKARPGAPEVGGLNATAAAADARFVSTLSPVQPRLLDLPGTAAYLGVSEWTVRDLEAAGVLGRVRVPLPNGGELRKLLFDREDLDRLIGVWKERVSG